MLQEEGLPIKYVQMCKSRFDIRLNLLIFNCNASWLKMIFHCVSKLLHFFYKDILSSITLYSLI